ncbi:hypothetical protein B0H11DRAFT_1912906 [Mycena galericulata]|nr:hypothetical protein B0H11DRAFT_1912906 [Mycena galericulata]
MAGEKFKSFRAFDAKSLDGYHGFIPSSQWLRDLFDKFIELHGHDFDQAMSLLTHLEEETTWYKVPDHRRNVTPFPVATVLDQPEQNAIVNTVDGEAGKILGMCGWIQTYLGERQIYIAEHPSSPRMADLPMFESTGVLKPKRLLPVLVVTSVLLMFAITSSSLGDSEFNECMAHSLSAASPFAAAVHDPAQNIDVAKFNTSRSLNGAASQSFKENLRPDVKYITTWPYEGFRHQTVPYFYGMTARKNGYVPVPSGRSTHLQTVRVRHGLTRIRRPRNRPFTRKRVSKSGWRSTNIAANHKLKRSSLTTACAKLPSDLVGLCRAALSCSLRHWALAFYYLDSSFQNRYFNSTASTGYPPTARAPRMREALIKYEEQPLSKSLPKRGTIFPSRSEAVAFNSVKWILINLVLFLLPSASALTALFLLGSRLGTSIHGSPHDLAFFIAYLAVCSGSSLVFSVVTGYMTAGDLYQRLADLGLVPTKRTCFYFTYRGRRIPWEDAIGAYGVAQLSHLQLHLVVLGGANEDQPTASSSRPRRERDTTRLEEVLQAEQMDEEGNPENPRTSAKRKRAAKSKRKAKPVENSDAEDMDYGTDENGDASSDSSDPDVEEVLPNSELADSLPTKTIPENSRRRRTDPKPPKKKSKGKAKAMDPPVQSGSVNPSIPVQPPVVRKQRKASKPRNAIFHFFEEVDQNSDGSVEDGARYYKCYLGNRKVFKIGRKMNYNTHGLQSHLESHFLAHYRLFKVLNGRGSPPTDVELALARGSAPMTPEKTAEYLEQLDSISNNIKEMFEKQAAASEEPWNQQHFEDLLAKWVAACDQPFSAVDALEFRELLQYTHHPALHQGPH